MDRFDQATTSRRDLLKKAAVGTAIVWTAPVVTSAVTPAAAQTGIVTSFSDATSLNANCNSGEPCSLVGTEGSPEWGNSGNPGQIRIDVLSSNDTIVSVHQIGDETTGGCAFEESEATVTQNPSGYECKITAIFLNCAVGGNTVSNFTEYPIAVPATTVDVPACPDNGTSPCNYFIRAAVSCTPV